MVVDIHVDVLDACLIVDGVVIDVVGFDVLIVNDERILCVDYDDDDDDDDVKVIVDDVDVVENV